MKIRISLTQDFCPVNKKVADDGEITKEEIDNLILDLEATIELLNDGNGTITIEKVYDETIDDRGNTITRSRMYFDNDPFRKDDGDSTSTGDGDSLGLG